jgi:hypothetical protein
MPEQLIRCRDCKNPVSMAFSPSSVTLCARCLRLRLRRLRTPAVSKDPDADPDADPIVEAHVS